VTLDAESRLNLDHDEPAVVAFLRENDGLLERDDRLEGGGDPAVYWLTMRPSSQPDEKYYVRLEWEAYTYKPPSIKFADAIRGSLTVTHAWPSITGYRAASFDICRPMCREGYAVHPEWNQGSTAWPTDGNPFLWVVQTIQFHMDNNEYQGRAQ
jgi:hypothetical protein